MEIMRLLYLCEKWGEVLLGNKTKNGKKMALFIYPVMIKRMEMAHKKTESFFEALEHAQVGVCAGCEKCSLIEDGINRDGVHMCNECVHMGKTMTRNVRVSIANMGIEAFLKIQNNQVGTLVKFAFFQKNAKKIMWHMRVLYRGIFKLCAGLKTIKKELCVRCGQIYPFKKFPLQKGQWGRKKCKWCLCKKPQSIVKSLLVLVPKKYTILKEGSIQRCNEN